jgi:hypothetical protein
MLFQKTGCYIQPDITSQLHLTLSISEHDNSCSCDHALFLVLKLSYGLVRTGWWAHPNGNLVLNCAGSLKRFLRTKVARWKERISSSKLVKRPMCIIHRIGWRITQSTLPERRVLHLESLCYNKSRPGPKLSASLRLTIENLPYLFQSPVRPS